MRDSVSCEVSGALLVSAFFPFPAAPAPLAAGGRTAAHLLCCVSCLLVGWFDTRLVFEFVGWLGYLNRFAPLFSIFRNTEAFLAVIL